MKPIIIKVCKLLIFADGYGNNIISYRNSAPLMRSECSVFAEYAAIEQNFEQLA